MAEREIAEALFVSPRRVGADLSLLPDKLGVHNRTAAAALADCESIF